MTEVGESAADKLLCSEIVKGPGNDMGEASVAENMADFDVCSRLRLTVESKQTSQC